MMVDVIKFVGRDNFITSLKTQGITWYKTKRFLWCGFNWTDWKLSQIAVFLLIHKAIKAFELLFSLLLLFLVGWDWVHLVLRPLLAYHTSPRW
jgi:hypothetical protein